LIYHHFIRLGGLENKQAIALITELTISLARKSKLRFFMAINFNNKTILIFYYLKTMWFQSVTTSRTPYNPFS